MNADKGVVLIVEDDDDIAGMLSLYLEGSGYGTLRVSDGAQGLARARQEHIDAMLVDLMLPKVSGYDFIREVRTFCGAPVVVVSACTATADKSITLDLGADGYVTKPFDPLEVVALVGAVVRRYRGEVCQGDASAGTRSADVIKVGDLSLDTTRFVLTKGGNVISLTTSEFKIMLLFMSSPGRVFTKAQIYEAIAGETPCGCDASVMVHISNIRAKLAEVSGGGSPIETVRGLGYRFGF